MSEIKVGDKFWVFDGNRRRYVNSKPQFDYHFAPVEITGETSRSWIVDGGGQYEFKAPKSDPFKYVVSGRAFYKKLLTDEDKANKVWDNKHKYTIIEDVSRATVTQLKQIAKIIGYQDNE